MGIFDKFAEQMESLGKKSKEVIETQATTLSKKSKEVMEITKLKFRKAQIEGQIKEKYSKIGEEVYKSFQGEKLNSPLLEKVCKEIEELDDEIKELNMRIIEMNPSPICPKCKAKNQYNAQYCSNCGSRLLENELIEISKED